MKSFLRIGILAVSLACLSPSIAWADAGTPLIWASLLHLVAGNFFLGLLEANLLIWRYRTRPFFSIIMMIMANYASSWIGFLLIGSIFSTTVSTMTGDAAVPLHSQMISELLMLLALFTITVVIEWPFCYFVLQRGDTRKEIPLALRSLKASVLLQSISYSCICTIYVWLRIKESGW